MKQLVQDSKTGEIIIIELPKPSLRAGGVLVRNNYSLISAGTERSSIETAKSSLIKKAKQRPDLVRQVMENLQKEGLKSTYQKVMSRLVGHKALGYSSAGVVVESSCSKFTPGNLVACAGAGYANHAEYIWVPEKLTTLIPLMPDGTAHVSDEEAAFTTVGAIALQGVRQAGVKLGEDVVVIGLGLVGLLTVGLLNASGVRVIGSDISENNFEIAKKMGAYKVYLMKEISTRIDSITSKRGADAVIITASTKSDAPINTAAEISRKKGRLVIVGAVGMGLRRNPYFYEKELEVRASTSYGPGRYDPNYEELGHDYPIGYVRWTEQRNMEAFLSMIAQNKISVKNLITHEFPIENAKMAYDVILGKTDELHVGVLLSYGEENQRVTNEKSFDKQNISSSKIQIKGEPSVAFIGAGNFASALLIPNVLKWKGVTLEKVCTQDPIKGSNSASKFGFNGFTTDPDEIFSDSGINVVFIATRHDSHSEYVIKAAERGKHIFIEKPLCINKEELIKVMDCLSKNGFENSGESNDKSNPTVLVGFNRRFSAAAKLVSDFFSDGNGPFEVNIEVNAPYLPTNHWTQMKNQGGRIVGEGCHFIDFMQFITGAKPVNVYAKSINRDGEIPAYPDNISAIMEFSDGSVGNLHYLTGGNNNYPKEFIRITSNGLIATIIDFKKVVLYSGGKSRIKNLSSGKGHKEELAEFYNSIQYGKPLISPESLYLTTLTAFCINESISAGKIVEINIESIL